jgi:hypothetical protein
LRFRKQGILLKLPVEEASSRNLSTGDSLLASAESFGRRG